MGDGSFCNRIVLAEDWDQQNVSVTVRCRNDIVLCQRAPGRGRRFYGRTRFTPERVRRRESLAGWKTTAICHGGGWREVRDQELSTVYGQGGARKRPVRRLVGAPVGDRTRAKGRKYDRQPADLLTPDLTPSAEARLQDSCDRGD